MKILILCLMMRLHGYLQDFRNIYMYIWTFSFKIIVFFIFFRENLSHNVLYMRILFFGSFYIHFY